MKKSQTTDDKGAGQKVNATFPHWGKVNKALTN